MPNICSDALWLLVEAWIGRRLPHTPAGFPLRHCPDQARCTRGLMQPAGTRQRTLVYAYMSSCTSRRVEEALPGRTNGQFSNLEPFEAGAPSCPQIGCGASSIGSGVLTCGFLRATSGVGQALVGARWHPPRGGRGTRPGRHSRRSKLTERPESGEPYVWLAWQGLGDRA